MRSGVGLAHLALLHRLLAKLLHARLYARHARVQQAGLRLDGDDLKPFLRRSLSNTCKRVGAQIRSLGRATRGLAGGFEGAGATA